MLCRRGNSSEVVEANADEVLGRAYAVTQSREASNAATMHTVVRVTKVRDVDITQRRPVS